MARQKKQNLALFDALTIEGALISPAMLALISQRDAGQQAENDYNIPKGLTLRDEIARYFRIGQAHFQGLKDPTPKSTLRVMTDLLRDVFGFADIRPAGIRTLDGRQYAVTLEALGGRVPVIVVPPGDDLDRASDHIPGDGRRRSAASAIQDWLNASDDALWGFACNGERLRLVRDNASLTRPAYIEANLRQIFEAEGFADFAALWLLIHATRFGKPGSPAADCMLERWREQGTKAGLAARDRLREGVEAALQVLGEGFLTVNPDLRERVKSGALPLPDYFGQLLRLVYRLIFLAVTEERGLLHNPGATPAARKLYGEGYSVSSLKERATRRAAWDRHHDRWEGLLIVFDALARGEKRLGLPALAGLFLPDLMPDLLNARLSNRALMEAIYRLAWLKDDGVLTPVNWRDMETEELGSVYESLLELTPRIADEGRKFTFAEGAETRGNARKTTGSYYTPDSLVQALLDTALEPVLDRVEREADDPTQALLGITVIDPACGSGHFLLAAARRIATRVARARAGGVASAEDFRHALRDVARNAIHGVDRNPMAVELTKVALWIETVEPGKPLGFLDANIRCGDALLGVFDLAVLDKGIPDEAYKPLTGDDKATAKYFAKRNKVEREGQGTLGFLGGAGHTTERPRLAEQMKALRNLAEDTPEEIEQKRKRFTALSSDSKAWAWRLACDLYVGAFLAPKTGGVPKNQNEVTIPTTEFLRQALAGKLQGRIAGIVQELAGSASAFHWPLAFPDVMAKGGFDVVVGNPPWDQIQLDAREFFAVDAPDIATAENMAARNRLIQKLKTERPSLYNAYCKAEHSLEKYQLFIHECGRFPTSSYGRLNTAPLFVELVVELTAKRGRSGVLVPTGIATDAFNQHLFNKLVHTQLLRQLTSFENEEFIFPSVHHSFRFCLLVLGRDETTSPKFSFFLRGTRDIADPERGFTLSSEEIKHINPNTQTAPIFRSREDAKITAKIYARVPVLIDENAGDAGNPWGMSFQLMFMMNTASSLFRTSAQLIQEGYSRDGANWRSGSKCYVPLYEAKMVHQYDHRWATYDGVESRDISSIEKSDPNFEATPRYWIEEKEVQERLSSRSWKRDWLIGWRDITSAHVLRTVIATAFPRAGVGNKLPLMFPSPSHSPTVVAGLIGNLSSLVLDYVARQKVGGTTLNFYLMYQFPVLPPETYEGGAQAFLAPRVLELIYTSHAMAPFARDLGYDGPPFGWDEDRRSLLRAELDAFYAKAYGLTRDELRYILDPADVMGQDYPSETFRVLKINEIRQYGEYRTRRLVLDAWDRMEQGELK